MCGAGHAVAGAVRELRDHGHDAEVFSTILKYFSDVIKYFQRAHRARLGRLQLLRQPGRADDRARVGRERQKSLMCNVVTISSFIYFIYVLVSSEIFYPL